MMERLSEAISAASLRKVLTKKDYISTEEKSVVSDLSQP